LFIRAVGEFGGDFGLGIPFTAEVQDDVDIVGVIGSGPTWLTVRFGIAGTFGRFIS
jgi:hypothetical protein